MKLSSIMIALGIASVICAIAFIPGPDRHTQETQRREALKTGVEESIMFVEKNGYKFAVIVWSGRGSDSITFTQLDPTKREPIPPDKEQ